MSELRVLHVADLHVDSPMRGLVAYDGAPEDEIRAATHTASRDLVAAAIERRVNLVLLAGDLYDGTWRDSNTGLFVVSQLAELHDAGIPPSSSTATTTPRANSPRICGFHRT